MFSTLDFPFDCPELRKLNKQLYEIVNFIVFDDENYFADVIFEDYVYEKDPKHYQKIVKELMNLIRDDYVRDLEAPYDYPLYRILNIAEDLYKDMYEDFYNMELTESEKHDIKKKIELCADFRTIFFIDHDFLLLELYVKSMQKNDTWEEASQIGLDQYTYLLPQDMEDKYKKSYDIIYFYEKFNNAFVNVYRSEKMIYRLARGFYEQGYYYLLNDHLSVQCGDIIEEIDYDTKTIQKFRVEDILTKNMIRTFKSIYILSGKVISKEFIDNQSQNFIFNNITINNNLNINKYNKEIENEALTILKGLKDELHELNINNQSIKDIFEAIHNYEDASGTDKAIEKYLKMIGVLSDHITVTGPLVSLINLLTLIQ